MFYNWVSVLNDLHRSIHNLVNQEHEEGATGRVTDMYSSIDKHSLIADDQNVTYNVSKSITALGN